MFVGLGYSELGSLHIYLTFTFHVIGIEKSLNRFLIEGNKRIALEEMLVILVAIDKVRRTVYY